jgi:putative lipoprotein
LPPDAVAEITVIDATVADAKAPSLATVAVPSNGAQVPLSFSLPYDATRIDKSHLYTIRASIKSKGEVLFTSDIARGVITQGNPSRVDLVLSRFDPGAASGSGDLAGSSWVLTDLQGTAIVADTRPTLDFSAPGRVTGSGSCNRYFATVEMSGSSIRVGAVGATRMACGTAVSLQEVKFFEALESANRFTLEGGMLFIYGGAPRPLRFERAAP